MTTQGPSCDTDTTKPPGNEDHFWYCVVEATDANGKLNYEKLAKLAGYKNWNSAKAVFFGKRKQMRSLYGLGSDGELKEIETVDAGVKKVDAGVKKRERKKKETTKGTKKRGKTGIKEEQEEEQ